MKTRTILEVITIIILLIAVFACTVTATYRTPEFTEDTYTVKGGDCLWSIASEYCPDNMDIRTYIKLIMERNELTGSIIYPNQHLIVLVEAE